MKQRADVLLVERNLAPTRARAQALILAGRVFIGEERVDKSGALLRADAELTVRGEDRYVSRGGHKLEGALRSLHVEVAGEACIDVGASTGGFTDCLLQHGALRVYAIDVGQAQLHEKLRGDPRVVVREGTNARFLEAADFPEPITFAVVDASFIGIEKLLPALAKVVAPGGRVLALIKPQFQAGKAEARKHRGVIRDPGVRARAIAGAVDAVRAAGFDVLAQCDCQVKGPKGNVEHFVLAVRSADPTADPA